LAKLPDAMLAVVPEDKLGGYLLDPGHKVGAPKLRFLESFGFDRARPDEVRRALLQHALEHEGAVTTTRFGLKYELDGALATPSGQQPMVRTVWMIEPGIAPRFVSMKPLRRR
jgi:hypothetical protein